MGAELQKFQEFNPADEHGSIWRGVPRDGFRNLLENHVPKATSGSGFKLITDGVIFHGKNSPRRYSKGYLPSHASHVMIPTLSASSVSADQREGLAMFMERLDQSRDLIRE